MKRLLIAAALVAATCSVAASGDRVSGSNITQSAPAPMLTSAQRAALVKEIGARWSGSAIRSSDSGVEAGMKLVRLAGKADDANLLAAAEMPTYESMMGALQGQSTDSRGMAAAMKGDGTNALGSAIADTVFTPLPAGRCRVADSRAINLPTVATVVRQINVEDVADYSSQGGNGSTAGNSSTACSLPTGAVAYMVGISVLPLGQDGFFKLFETGKAFSEGNTAVYGPLYGSTNDVVVRSCTTCTNELSIYSDASTHYVLDVIGYFMAPEATALQCTETFVTGNVLAGDAFDTQIPSCPTGYAITGAGCRTPNFDDVTWSINGLYRNAPGSMRAFCSGINNSAGTIAVEGTAQCCRVPGR